MDAVEEIKSRLDVDEVVGSYVQLKPAGSNLRGICPFHQEKTPSFMVSPEKGIWHCFGCGEGGDIFTFVEKMEGLDFRETLENLAKRAGVELEATTPKSAQAAKAKERLHKALELATKYFQTAFVKSKTAQNYIIKRRGFNKSTVQNFRLGYAPDAQSGLADFLQKQGFTTSEIVAAGLARKKNSGLQDVFRGRMMVPFIDASGRVIGFTGRVISDDSFGPKYLNTPQTMLFDKSRFIFGLNLARDAIRSNDEAVITEGNLDVLTSAQAGVANVVATSGTALTHYQVKTLSRLSKNVKLAFDQDKAGLAATERIIPIAQEAGVTLSIVDMQGAKDPDELIQRDLPAWKKAIKEAPYVVDWLLNNLAETYDTTTATGKKQISDRALNSIGRLSDPVEQDHYVTKLSKLIDISADSIWQKLKNSSGPKPTYSQKAKYQADLTKQPASSVVEDALLAINLAYADSRASLDELTPDYFTSDERKGVFSAIRDLGGAKITNEVPKALLPWANYVKILLLKAEEEFVDWATLDRRIEAFSLSQRLQQLHLKHTKQMLQADIAKAEQTNDQSKRYRLLKEFRDISK